MNYNALVWLLPPNYDKLKNCYTPNTFLLETLGPKLEQVADDKGLILDIQDGSLFNFKIAQGAKDYFTLLENKTAIFESSLIIISYTDDSMLLRDKYLAKLAKIYTCWDTSYVNYPEDKDTELVKDFTYVVRNTECPDKLLSIITDV